MTNVTIRTRIRIKKKPEMSRGLIEYDQMVGVALPPMPCMESQPEGTQKHEVNRDST